ncbi:diguanylate phosphodiesterase [Vibrio albus]|uniref:Diguanylate phosphodiesterase n=1 Tax=Vibrio albus TaxID=2200953 RepID=A0A2U3BAS2_9VIBR|nr:EAL domain-containing protein [Vibrio albus]PWI33824.1 diguanylate phosphodiesterase [Vibrio albus]
MSDEHFVFLDESDNAPPPDRSGNGPLFRSGKILSVDDDPSYQQSILYSLRDFMINGQPVELLTASSATEAACVLTQHDDIALILLDVVMEKDDAGLRLVETIRNIQGNALIRIILLTGQPGVAPRKEVMHKYDINEYWNKSEIDYDTLRSVVAANLRSWQSMYELEQARIGLQMVVDASRHLARKYDTESFIQVVIKEIGHIIGGGDDLILCVTQIKPTRSEQQCKDVRVVAATGIDDVVLGNALPKKLQDKFGTLCRQAISEHSHQFEQNRSVLYFAVDCEDTHYYLVMAEAKRDLSDYHIHLLQVFSENISSGFMQIALVNQLSRLAYQDSELQINNRNWLLRELDAMNDLDMQESELLVLEIDHFDSHVLSFDEIFLLQTVAAIYENICQVCSPHIAVARISVDGFAVLLHKRHSQTDTALMNLTNQANELQECTIRHTLTIVRTDLALMKNLPALQILHLTKSMLYYARQQGKAYFTYHPKYREQLLHDYQTLGDLREAIDNHEFYLALQPKIDMRDGHPIGFEALLRWKKQGKIIPPGEFIPLAEQTGLITKLDPIVVQLAIEAIHELDQAGFRLPISFNATVKDLANPKYIHLILDAIKDGLVRSELVDIEITETQAMESYEQINPILERLHKAGVHISIDDFGTGYSSLSHISQLAADTIKIDIAFVAHLDTDTASQQVVELVMSLASQFGFDVVAEGVETDIQRDELLKRGCYFAQGYLYAKPMPVDELVLWLRQHYAERR